MKGVRILLSLTPQDNITITTKKIKPLATFAPLTEEPRSPLELITLLKTPLSFLESLKANVEANSQLASNPDSRVKNLYTGGGNWMKKSKSNHKIFTAGASLNCKDGISRVVSELSSFFEGELVILTDSYAPNLTYKLSVKSYILRTGHEKRNLAHFIKEIIIWIVLMLRLKKQKVIIVTHNFYSMGLANMLKMLFPWKIKVYAFIYDVESICSLDSYLLKPIKWIFTYVLRLGVTDKILVLDKRIARLTHKLLNTNRVFIIRIGVSSSLIELQHKLMSGSLPLPEKVQYALKKGKSSIKLFFNGILIPRRRVEDLIVALNDVTKIKPDVV